MSKRSEDLFNEDDKRYLAEIMNKLEDKIAFIYQNDDDKILESLDWLEDVFNEISIDLPEKHLLQLLDLLTHENGHVVRQCFYVLKECVACQSTMTTFLIAHGLLDDLESVFPEMSSIEMTIHLCRFSRETRDELVSRGFVDKIRNVWEINISSFARLLAAFGSWPIAFDEKASSIFDLFLMLLDSLSCDDVVLAGQIAEAFFGLIRMNERFMFEFVNRDIIDTFLTKGINDSKYQYFTLRILLCLCNSVPIDYLLDKNIIMYARSRLLEQNNSVSSVAVDLFSDMALQAPQLTTDIYREGIPAVVIQLYYSTASAAFKEAAVHFFTVMMFFCSERRFDEMYLMGCLGVLLDGHVLIIRSEVPWVLGILKRAIAPANEEHNQEYAVFLRAHPSLIQWLEELSTKGDEKESKLSKEILHFICDERFTES